MAENKEEILQEVEVVMKIDDVDFNGIEEYFGIMKMDDEFTFEQFLELFLWEPVTQHLIDYDSLVEDWEKYPAFTAMDCIIRFKDNQQKMMVAMKHLGPERVFEAMNAELLDEATVEKTQMRTRLKNPELKKHLNRSSEVAISKDDIEEYEHKYTENIKLHKVARSAFQEKGVTLRNDVFIVECICPSTDHHFFLFVDGNVEQCHTAIGALAWTMQKPDGTPLTPEEYMELAKNGKEA